MWKRTFLGTCSIMIVGDVIIVTVSDLVISLMFLLFININTCAKMSCGLHICIP